MPFASFGFQAPIEDPVGPHGTRRNGHLCGTCENFDIHSFTRDPFGFRGYRYKAAKEAAGQGYSFCSLLISCFEDKLSREKWRLPKRHSWEGRWWIHLDVKSPGKRQDVESGGAALMISVLRATLASENHTLPYTQLRRGPPGRYPSVDFHVVADPGCPAASNRDIPGRYPGEDAQSDDYISIIKAWLQICLSHTRCSQTISGQRSINATRAPLPTRCVEVLGGGLRLRETGSERGSYIALSHRWTEETELCCTTTANINARRRENADWPQVLPKTFLHTLDLARRLGAKYVWIDSLCIIQHGDDGDDWRQESVKMADYYQQSLLTIVATSGSEEHGLFPPKKRSPPTIARLPYRDRNGSRQGFFYVYSYNKAVSQQYQSFIQESELLTRGWVFQEWLLSRRVVYFTPGGMFVERETERPHNERGEASQTWSSNDLPIADQPLAKMAFLFETGSISSLWYRIVESYSALSLTKPEKDRTVALAGVAKEFREALTKVASGNGPGTATVPSGLESVSGLWLCDLHRGLLWEQKSSECTPRRLSELPTWSWASTVCPVVWDDKHNTHIKPQVEAVSVTTSEGDVFSIDSSRQAPDFMSPTPKAFDVDNRFGRLCMTGKVQQVVVRENFYQKQDLEIARSASGHDVESAKALWRKVCSNLRPKEITGWASIEHPNYQEESEFQAGLEIDALFRLLRESLAVMALAISLLGTMYSTSSFSGILTGESTSGWVLEGSLGRRSRRDFVSPPRGLLT